MHKLFARQLAQAMDAGGTVDLDRLGDLVAAAYEESDRDRRRTDRSISLMVEELDQHSRRLEDAVADRTLALMVREAELQAQNVRFDAAINNMSQALLMFDSAAWRPRPKASKPSPRWSRLGGWGARRCRVTTSVVRSPRRGLHGSSVPRFESRR